MDPDFGTEGGGTPFSPSAAADYTLAPAQVQPGLPAADTPQPLADLPAGAAGRQVPWPLLVRLGFVAVMLIVAVVMVALGYTAAAAACLILGVGLASVEIIKRLS